MGHVVGGWEYVWAAYGITWAGLLLYGLSLYVRRKERK
jgi:heme exporter protein D